jgi:hypothetical protein
MGRELLKQADAHTLLRLPTGIFYAQGVKANVLFFDRKPAAEKPWTEKLWISAARTVWWGHGFSGWSELLDAVRLCPKISWTCGSNSV